MVAALSPPMRAKRLPRFCGTLQVYWTAFPSAKPVWKMPSNCVTSLRYCMAGPGGKLPSVRRAWT